VSDDVTDEANREKADALLEALWARVMDAWDEEKPHHALAGRYRAVKENDPEKAARAQKKLDGIVIAATHLLMAMKTPASPHKVPTWVTATAFVICMILIGWVTRLVFRRG